MSNPHSVIADVRRDLNKLDGEFKMALPPHISVEKFKRVALTAIQSEPDLMRADRRSLFGACVKAAQDGLLPDKREAALVIFKGTVQYMPMIAGILKRVRNSGEVASIASQLVYRKDVFRYWVDGDGEHIQHEPLMFGERGDIVGAYGVAKTKDGAVYIEVMTKADIEKVRSVSRAKNSGPWSDWWEEMARKTVLRRLSKRLPMSTDIEDVIRREEEQFVDTGPAPARPRLADFDAPQIEYRSDHGEDAADDADPQEQVGEDNAAGDEITVSDEYGNVEYVGFDRKQALSVLQKLRAACKDAASVDVLSEHNADLWPDLPK